jgi:hypothetical protein
MIPKSQDFDSVLGQKLIACLVMLLPGSIIVSTTIKFNGQLRRRAITIYYARIDRMLSSKFVTSKIPIPQVPPKNAFPFRGMLAQVKGLAHGRANLTAIGYSEQCVLRREPLRVILFRGGSGKAVSGAGRYL